MRSRALLVSTCFLGCAGNPSPPAPETQKTSNFESAALEPAPEAVQDAPSEDAAEGGTKAPDTKPKPEPAPPPALESAPDGTEAIACASAPERMSCIPAGPFVRGRDEAERSNEMPSATIWAQTFYMDQYEVTYAEYKACQKEKRCPRSGPRYTDFDHPDMPIQGVSWFDSLAYCEAHGKTLPTEAQWEKAARGPDGEIYPWGDDPADCDKAIIKDGSGRSCGLKKAISKPETGRPWDVGSRPVGRYGLYDMVGNSWEWVYDWYSRSYEACGDACVGVDPRGPCDGDETCKGHSQKIIRGGSWYWDETRATGTYRRAHFPSNGPHFHHFGFRCAATVEQAQALTSAGSLTGDDTAGEAAAAPEAG
ncbi:MAG: formylglycine-generating enzyme family protein [Nannocystales bacterium]